MENTMPVCRLETVGSVYSLCCCHLKLADEPWRDPRSRSLGRSSVPVLGRVSGNSAHSQARMFDLQEHGSPLVHVTILVAPSGEPSQPRDTGPYILRADSLARLGTLREAQPEPLSREDFRRGLLPQHRRTWKTFCSVK